MVIDAIVRELRLTWRLLRDPRVPIWTKIFPFLGLIYVISPLDFIPDVIIGLGQLDDLGIIFAGLRLFKRLVPADLLEEHQAVIEGRRNPDEVVEAKHYTIRDK
ncbi:MAG: DUF1232 domain-containing protein [Anaerolineae bacterium]|nr:DUF1232 domain-containing protein [Anaerolineae bacterium]